MKLLRRKPPEPNAAQKALSVVKLAARGLAVQRIARNAFGAYKFARRLPMIIGGAVVAVFALRKLRGSGDDAGPETWTAPPSTPAPAPIHTAPAATTPAAPPVQEAPASTTPGSAAGTTDGGSDAVAEDPSDAIGADLAAAAEGGPSDDKIPTPGQEDLRAPAPDETS